MIAALFVEPNGVYFGQPEIDPWDESRDARKYNGPHPVIAHPPCKRWGRYWSGGPSAKVRRNKGYDMGCFAAALYSVRTFGGVLEHPEASHAWAWYGIPRPQRNGGWIYADHYGGYTCCVEQGHYGHAARKATWLYYVGKYPQPLEWGPSTGKARMDQGFHSSEEWMRSTHKPCKRLSAKQRLTTPIPFRDALIALVRDNDR